MRKVKVGAKPLSDDQLVILKENALGILSNARRTLLQRHPFIGSVAMQLDIVPIRDIRCSTACTDGSTIYFDIDFLSDLTPEEQVFVLGHEVWHNVMRHMMRKDTRDHELFNIATDCEINQILMKDGFTMPTDGCLPKKFNLPDDLSAEEYYDLLEAQQQKQKSGSGMSMFGEGDSADGDGDDCEGNANDGNDAGHRGKNGKMSGQFDKHIYDGEEIEDAENSTSLADKYGKLGIDKDFKANVNPSDVEKIREAAVSAAQMIERQMGRGSLPSYIEKLIKDLLEPTLPWPELLAKFITKSTGEGRANWSTPNRRFAYTKTYLPSHRSDKIKIAIGIDTSGSCSGSLIDFLSEINGIVKCFGNYELTVIQCDTEVKDVTVYNDDNQLDVENNGIEFKGFGGTELHPIFDYIKDNELDVDACLVYTDGECEEITEAMDPGIPVMWVLNTKNASDTMIKAIGETINIAK